MVQLKNRVYLASRSLRRRELLKQIGVNFELLLLRETPLHGMGIDETPLPDESPTDYACRIAKAKAEAGWIQLIQRRVPLLPVLAADTVVSLKGQIFGKPENSAHAEEMLAALSGQTHEVLTAVAMTELDRVQVHLSTTSVQFRNISKCEIRAYIAVNEAHDKAGAYAIQGVAAVFIAKISGSYSGVMGLPLFETARLLEEFGVEVLH
ncbi:MAG: nucleoside triphosphate pyrophosphatase [Nitrosomonadaceae bacterium]|nr:nucleoside triphosphate pyrophosphatase [Nitrosomonadaceae bacterium]